jgi:hypothetical protein
MIKSYVDAAYLIVSARAGVFANFPNTIAEITGKLEDVEKAKDQGVFCQYWLIGPNMAVLR